MSKSTRFTQEDLDRLGLEEWEPGQFRPKQKIKTKAGKAIIIGDNDNLTRAGEEAKKMWMGIDPASDEQSHSAVVKKWADGTIESVMFDGNKTDKYELDEQGVISTGVNSKFKFKNPLTPDECIKPFDIAAIRVLGSGTKKRKQSMDDLHRFAKELVENRGVDSIYIKGNVASSKNSKEIAKFKKKVMGKTVEMTSLIDSKATRAYRTETSRQWGAHLQHFKDIVKDKPYPLHIHFTFIRKTLGRFDLVNAAQGPLDIMVEKGYIEDDSSEHVIPVFNPVVYYSKEYAGLLIKVL